MGTRSRTIIKICLITKRSKRQLVFFMVWNSPSHPAKPTDLSTFNDILTLDNKNARLQGDMQNFPLFITLICHVLSYNTGINLVNGRGSDMAKPSLGSPA